MINTLTNYQKKKLLCSMTNIQIKILVKEQFVSGKEEFRSYDINNEIKYRKALNSWEE